MSYSMSTPFGTPEPPLFSLPTVGREKVVAAFDGGRITSDGGVMLLGAVELSSPDEFSPKVAVGNSPLRYAGCSLLS
jgi:hypothetical protein